MSGCVFGFIFWPTNHLHLPFVVSENVSKLRSSQIRSAPSVHKADTISSLKAKAWSIL